MLHLLTIIGARPQIIKASALCRAIQNVYSDRIRQTLVHTGQHYDDVMSAVFFRELGIPEPIYQLNIGSENHARQTAAMMTELEAILLLEKPDAVVVYGDTNSTLAGALTASKLNIAVIHIEAGLRSFNKSMPEEINRVLCDHVSTFLFTPTRSGWQNLEQEGLTKHTQQVLAGKYAPSADNPVVFQTGDIMLDNSLYYADKVQAAHSLPERLKLVTNQFFLATLHRQNNTDTYERLESIFLSLIKLIDRFQLPIVMPLHPRTKKALHDHPELLKQLEAENRLLLIPPVSFFEMLVLQKKCRIVLTDSGGVQKEAYFFNRPCVILRSETEWVELVNNGAARLTDVDFEKIGSAVNDFMEKTPDFPNIFGDGHAAEEICRILLSYMK